MAADGQVQGHGPGEGRPPSSGPSRLIPQNGGIKCAPQNGGAQTLLVEGLNQLGRRNLTRDQRDALIKRLAASGVPKSEIAGAVGLSRRRTQEIAQGAETAQAPAFTTPDLTVTVHGEVNNSPEPGFTIP